MKKEEEMNIQEAMNLHSDNPKEIMESFIREIIALDYTSKGIGKASAFLYDIIT